MRLLNALTVAVVVPFRGGCPHREAAWGWVRRRYAEKHPNWELIEAPAPDGPWCKGAALAAAIAASSAEMIIQADADVWCDGLLEAVETVREGAPWALPHNEVRRLTQEATAAVLAGDEWERQPLLEDAYPGVVGGGILVAPRETLCEIPVDPRFTGWGQEDESHGRALRTLIGTPWKGSAPLVHFWHPPQERISRGRGSAEGWALRRRYDRRSQSTTAMSKLLDEIRGTSDTPTEPRRFHMTIVRFYAPDNPNYNISSQQLFQPIFFDKGVFETDDPTEIDILRKAAGVVEEPATTTEAAEAAAVAEPETKSEPPKVTDQERSGNSAPPTGGEGQSS